jgi:RNA polymerase I-specific transcription initiation factor RRN7
LQTKLRPGLLHHWTNQLALLYRQEFNITFPSLNYPPILWTFAKAMSFPVEIHSIAMRISKLLELTEFRFAEHTKWERSGGTPDSKLMALLIVSCELGFDLERTSAWKEWAGPIDKERGINRMGRKEDIEEGDILEMADEEFDEYMDWMQSTWLDDAEGKRNS